MTMRTMAATAPELISVVAKATGVDPGQVKRHWRELREAGMVPAGKRGRGGAHATVDGLAAARLLISLLATSVAKAAARTVRLVGALEGSKLYYVRDESPRILCVMAPAKARFDDAIANLVNARRCRTPALIDLHDCAGGFEDIRVCSSKGEIWGEIDAAPPVGHAWPHRHNRIVYLADIGLATGALYARRRSGKGTPAWAIPAGLERISSIRSVVILRVAQALGPIDHRPDWPRFERVSKSPVNEGSHHP